jgi:hypothetical protein
VLNRTRRATEEAYKSEVGAARHLRLITSLTPKTLQNEFKAVGGVTMFRAGLLTVTVLSCLAYSQWATAAVTNSTQKPKPASSPSSPTVFQGTVAIVTNSQLVLATRNEKRSFVVPSNALIVVNRAEASLQDVMPGQYASVASVNSNGQLVANFIHATRQY